MELLQEVRVGLPYSLTIPLLCRNPKEPQLPCRRDTCTATSIAVLLAINYLLGQPRYPSTREERKSGTYTQWNFNPTVKNKVMASARIRINPDIITLNKVSQTQNKTLVVYLNLLISCLLCHFAFYLYKKEFVWPFFPQSLLSSL